MVAGLDQIQDGRLTSQELASYQVETVHRCRLLEGLAPVQEACACEDETHTLQQGVQLLCVMLHGPQAGPAGSAARALCCVLATDEMVIS